MSLPFEDQVAVITGASGGIGRAMALEFARQGAHLVLHGNKRLAGATSLAADIQRQSGRESLVLGADLTDALACERLVVEAWKWRSGVHIWANVAGADVLTGEAADWPFEQKLAALWQVDVLGSI